MFRHLSDKQKEILNFYRGTVVVKACPGSGKTYSVAARIAKLISENNYTHRGIAALSFTNVACNEISEKLKNDFNFSYSLNSPHQISTLDSFINNHIFLPYGHLFMNCNKRPQLVGEPFSIWNINRPYNNYDQYFDKTTFDNSGLLIRLASHQSFHFIWDYYNKQGKVNGHIQNIINSKFYYFKKGFANQSDANFISLNVIKKYPLIIENLANKFDHIIIDEAQDTDEIQMRIIESLKINGCDNIMLIGDRDQAIFEWNNAKPELFDSKYNDWEKIELNENRRSSQRICNFINHFSSFEIATSINEELKTFDYNPEIIGYKRKLKVRNSENWIVSPEESYRSVDKILLYFCATCEQNDIKINKENVAILYRGLSQSELLRIKRDTFEFDRSPWLPNNYHVKSLVRGKHLYENGQFKEGYRLLERGLIEAKCKHTNINFYFSDDTIENLIFDYGGLIKYRNYIFNLINLLPTTKNTSLNDWIRIANNNLGEHRISLNIEVKNGEIKIDELFGSNLRTDILPFYHGTVHSVKGRTFEAVLLLLGKKAGMNYNNMINRDVSELKPEYQEELRIVYVAISRPRKILMIGVPEEDVDQWKMKFKLE
jgi:superfamily I DNA/RNA helicase